MTFAEIILPLSLPRTLTYGVPEDLIPKIKVGVRVEVNLGKNKTYSGIVFQLHHDKPQSYRVKPIRKILDAEPIVNEKQLQFWAWIAAYYCCTLGDVMQTALPAHLKLMNETILIWNEAVLEIPTNLSDEGYLLAEALQIKKKLTVAEARSVTNLENHAQAIHEILEMGLATIEDTLKERYHPKKEPCVTLTGDYLRQPDLLAPVFDQLKKAPTQSKLLLQFLQIKDKKEDISVKELLQKSGATRSTLNSLVGKGIFEIYNREVSRLGNKGMADSEIKEFELNEEQKAALSSIKEQWKKKPVVLLHGVTGSGKTMIYIRLIQEALAKGEQVLFLLPEIALTTHIVQRLRAYFGQELGVYHSRFSNNERVEIWGKVNNGDYKILLGPRSALWLPYQNLKTIIVDEEHDYSFKQYDPAPRYHGRDAAIYLAGLLNARVLLGSATPALETIHNVQKEKFGYARLKSRYQNQAMPLVSAISAKNINPALSTILTLPLVKEINHTFSLGKQVLLFQNKRGYSPFLICAVCGFVPHCPQCDVSLTYHKATDKLHCHYCGQRYAPIKNCPQCGSSHIVSRSFGTEKVEEELNRIFPKRKVARMDTDSVRGKNRLQQLIHDFELGNIDILVGTQMIVKGLDFENVGLVGVLNADSLWSYPDFRVNERAFQLIEQVSGRAGRSLDGQGQVLVQAYNLKHPVLEWVREHDYKSFYRSEIKFREQFGYSPFSKLIKVIVKHSNQNRAAKVAEGLAEGLRMGPYLSVQGPNPALISKIRNKFLFEIWLKLPVGRNELTEGKNKLLSVIQTVQGQRGNSNVQIIIDVDPY